MKIITFALRSLWRDWRAGELRMMLAAIGIAVAAVTTVGFFTDRVAQATNRQATALLAADLVLQANIPIRPVLIELAHAHGLRTTTTLGFRSVVVAGDNLQLAEVKAVESGYPLRGKLRIAHFLFGAETVTDTLPAPGTVWVDSRLLQLLAINPGDAIHLGSAHLEIAALLAYEPDRGGDLFNIAPRVLMNLADVPATGLILPGSRVEYRLLLGGDADSILKFREAAQPLLEQDQIKIRDIRDARPELKTALERTDQYLGLAVLISIALAGLAVALSAQRHALRHFDQCAILRCLGTAQAAILKIHLCQLLLLSLAASLPGCVAGYLAQQVLALLMSGLTPEPLPPPGIYPALQGFGAGMITAFGFAAPQLLRLRNVSPLRVLRRELDPMPVSGLITYACAIAALALLTPWQSGRLALTLYTLLGILITVLLLWLGALFLIRILNRLRTQVGVAFRFGLTSIARRPGHSTVQIIGIGLGIMVMLLLTLVRDDLLESWRGRLPPDTPNYFVINIQPDQVHQVQSFLREQLNVPSAIYPMVRGRLLAINHRSINPDDYADDRARRLAAREFNLSWAAQMQSDNRIVQGQWWRDNATEILFSVEEGIAGTLGIKLDDMLSYNIAGRELQGRVINLRHVEWDSFNVNFFVIANPGTLEDYPATWITSFNLPMQRKQILTDLVRRFPSVTVFDVDAILTQVRRIMDQVTHTIEFVFVFTLCAGLVVLAAALNTTHDERIREYALLLALGASRRELRLGLFAEFTCIGLIAGVLAALSATIAEILLSEFVFHIDFIINPWVWLAAPVTCVTLVLIAGFIGTRQALATPPALTLRQT
jgi:putative ABC transport system permease protein